MVNTNVNEKFLTPDEFDRIQNSYECKVEYYNGEVWMTSNSSDRHNDIVINIASEIRSYLKGSKCKVKTEGMEVIFDEEEKYKFKPDVFIVCEKDIEAMKGESYTTPPKVIFEVVSQGKEAIKRDKQFKYNIYEHYGVIEYNIVEQNGFINQHALIDGYYQLINSYHKGETYEGYVFKELRIDMNDIF